MKGFTSEWLEDREAGREHVPDEDPNKTGPGNALSSPRPDADASPGARYRPAPWAAVDAGEDHLTALRLSTGERAPITRDDLAGVEHPITGRLTIHDDHAS